MAVVDYLIEQGFLKTEELIKAFRKVKRADFLPEELKDLADVNEALPIGSGQTISQPLVVAFMLELLDPKQGEKILDIGSGSGWTTALLAETVKEKGKVIALELIPEVKELGDRNISKYNYLKKGIVETFCLDGSKGYEKEAPFDKILVSASATKLPDSWVKQLKTGGRIVAPINTSIFRFIKTEKGLDSEEFPGFVFVPLITN